MNQQRASGKTKSPASAFIIMSIGNFLAMMVFAMLYLVYTPEGERYTLLLVAAIISLVCGIIMLFLYSYFQKKIEASRSAE